METGEEGGLTALGRQVIFFGVVGEEGRGGAAADELAIFTQAVGDIFEILPSVAGLKAAAAGGNSL